MGELAVISENNVLVFENDGQVVTDSLTIAEMFEKEHKHVVRDIEVQLEKLKEAGEQTWGESNFGQTQYQHPQNKQWYKKYLLTEDAFAIVVMAYVTSEAMRMKIEFLREFKRMKKHIEKRMQVPGDTFGQIELLATGTSNLNKRVSSLEQVVEKQLTVDYGQQRVIEKTKAKRIYFLWENGHVDKEVHDSTRKLFGLLGRNLKDAFNVNSYRDILKKDFEEALNFVNGWRPMI
ncbi:MULTISPECIES: Rha family transcriptional regulator [Bacillus]|uniref:Rha family transcriptional regulator n=1 Tax=Bacillus thuringiensis subsp. medellin TaxID=79672 RepID=A0A9X6MMC9_BACTV|nr:MULTISPECIES: Rha family transcriptional regulator [Bacillus]MDA2245445.1 Rha family transcriptional regulator [Bacillus cereus]OUB84127.1 Rha family transcriptional regulator [Bacillus thuringiensis serovar medellin]PFA84558.1 Rha family transcriptional regulator [Bacillus cereus]PGK73672.1 Rha family transcriptional regulator [Bacillus thuringiensis]PGN42334.1 Rha family transcriptional regulator [Bacillus thuringiensis]